MVQYVITPWRNRAELLQVRDKLYPGEGKEVKEEEKRHAVERVSVWMQRGNCPHLVESTAILTAAGLNDVSRNSTYCVRAAYSAAFCRFVTGLLDSHQDKARKLSMYSIAKTIGLPATYVELRHQATHEELPSLSKLRTATQKALRWIWDNYWIHLRADDLANSECKAFLIKICEEEDVRTRMEMEKSLGNWDEDELLECLLAILEGTNRHQTGIHLRLLRLQTGIFHRRAKVGAEKAEGSRGKQDMDVEVIKVEMTRMEAELNKHKDVQLCTEENDVSVDEGTQGNGWAIWEGPWVPKPIGVI